MRKLLILIGRFFKPMIRPIVIALSGQVVFIISVITMSPLRMWENPVVNYNLYYVAFLTAIFGFLFYRCCVTEPRAKAYLYGFFAALVAWPLLGETASLPVDTGLILQFSDLNIKLIGGWFYVVALWILLKILWRTQALKAGPCAFLMTFLAIWTFELYMDNYSSMIDVEMMPVIASRVVMGSVVIMVFLLWLARRMYRRDPEASLAKRTIIGCLMYIFFALFLMGSDQWKKPSAFYIKYEAKHIDGEIADLQAEKEHIEWLTQYMLENDMAKPKDLGIAEPAPESAPEAAH